MSQYIGVAKCEGKIAYVAAFAEVTQSKDQAQRFDTSFNARQAAAKLIGAKWFLEPDTFQDKFPWIIEVDAEEVQ